MTEPIKLSQILSNIIENWDSPYDGEENDPWHCAWCTEPITDQPCGIHQKPLPGLEYLYRGADDDDLDYDGRMHRNGP